MPGLCFNANLPFHRTKRCRCQEAVMTNIPDPSKCPICGQPNQCALSNPATATQQCWCFTAEIAPEARARISDDALNKACICQHCASGKPPANP
jgi:hypothetical protein